MVTIAEYPGISQTRFRFSSYYRLSKPSIAYCTGWLTQLLKFTTGTDYELNTTRPLKDGVSSYVKILTDHIYLSINTTKAC